MHPLETGGARRLAWRIVGLSYAAMAPLLALSKVSLDPASLVRAFLMLLFPLGLVLFARRRGMPRVALACEALAAGLWVSVPVIVSTYLAIAAGMPLADARLIAIDAALGFDWPGFVRWLDGFPRLAVLLELAYASFSPQLLIVPVSLALLGHPERAFGFVSAYALLGFGASAVAVAFPCVGAYVAHDVAPGSLAAVDPHYGFFFLEQFHALRDGAGFTLRLDRIAGLLTFPSVHAGVAALCAWAAWRSLLLRWPVLLLNVAMGVSALSHGGHYLVDVGAGFLLAAAVLWAMGRTLRAGRPLASAPRSILPAADAPAAP